MAVSTIQSIPAHPQANSYVSLAEALQYFTDHTTGAASWSAASADEKAQALIEATRLIDSYRFHKEKLKEWQSLEFPRSNTDVVNGIVQTSSSTTIQDDDLKNKISYPDDYWNYGALWFTREGDNNYMKFYLVTDFVASTGTLTLSPTISPSLANTEQYQLIKEIPRDVKFATLETALAIVDGTLYTAASSNIKRQKLDTEEVEYFDKSSQTVSLPGKAQHLLRPYISNTARVSNSRKFR